MSVPPRLALLTSGGDAPGMNIAKAAIDKIRHTAESHERFFLVEVMRRFSGFIAVPVGISGGAEEVLVPEQPFKVKDICHRLCEGKERGKTSSILVVAEGNEAGGAFKLAEELRGRSRHEYRVVILGHLQRGGSPTAADRVLATKLGAYAVDIFLAGGTSVMAGEVGGQLCARPLRDTFTRKKPLEDYLLRIHSELSACPSANTRSHATPGLFAGQESKRSERRPGDEH